MKILRTALGVLILSAACLAWPLRATGQNAAKPASTPASAPASTAAPAPASAPAAATAAKPAGPKPDRWLTQPGPSGRKVLIGALDGRLDQKGYPFQVELITDGAAINTVKLRGFYFTVADKKLAELDWPGYQKALRDDPERYLGPYSLMNPVRHESVRHLPLATRKITLTMPGQDAPMSWNLQHAAWVVEPAGPAEPAAGPADTESVSLSWTLYRNDAKHPVLKLIKTYTVRKDDYTIGVSLRAVNLSSQTLTVSLNQAGPTGLPREGHRADMRKAVFGRFLAEDGKVRIGKPIPRQAKVGKLKLDERESVGSSGAQDPMVWIGQVNKFFGAMMYLVPAVEDRVHASDLNAEFYVQDVLENATSGTHVTGLLIPKIRLAPGQSREVRLELFAGPKRREMFADAGAPYFKPRYRDLDYISTIELGGCFCAWDWLSLMMIHLLSLLSNLTFGNYGVAIIVLVILVRMVLHPLTKKGQVTMSKMKKLGPMMEELKKKYADDKEALNRERLKLYKGQGATPLLGCLPMLLQMPILIALWTGINASIDLRHAAFLPVWITDLAAPDALFSWSGELPFIGSSFNLLPVLLAGAMYWQMKLSPQSNQPDATPEQQKQQKMMAIMMVGMMPVIFYQAASGLTLYFLISTFFGAAESQIIRRAIEAKQQAAAEMETTIRLPGKAPRAARPKKPKGPMWFKRG